MAPSTPPPPRNVRLAALTMASTSRRVMSPKKMPTRLLNSSFTGGPSSKAPVFISGMRTLAYTGQTGMESRVANALPQWYKDRFSSLLMPKYRSRRDRMAAERDLVGESEGAPLDSFPFSSELPSATPLSPCSGTSASASDPSDDIFFLQELIQILGKRGVPSISLLI